MQCCRMAGSNSRAEHQRRPYDDDINWCLHIQSYDAVERIYGARLVKFWLAPTSNAITLAPAGVPLDLWRCLRRHTHTHCVDALSFSVVRDRCTQLRDKYGQSNGTDNKEYREATSWLVLTMSSGWHVISAAMATDMMADPNAPRYRSFGSHIGCAGWWASAIVVQSTGLGEPNRLTVSTNTYKRILKEYNKRNKESLTVEREREGRPECRYGKRGKTFTEGDHAQITSDAGRRRRLFFFFSRFYTPIPWFSSSFFNGRR